MDGPKKIITTIINDESEEGSSQYTFQFKQLERGSLKKSGLQRDSKRDLRDTGAMLYQLSYEATHWERGHFIDKLASLPMCGFITQWVEHRTGDAEVTGSNPAEALIFQASSFQLLKLENVQR